MKNPPKWLGQIVFIVCCMIGFMASPISARFVEIDSHLTPIFQSPSSNAKPVALGWRKSLLEITDESTTHYQVKLYTNPQSYGWLIKANLPIIASPGPNETSRIGMLTYVTDSESSTPTASIVTIPKPVTPNFEAEYTFLPDKRESFMYPRYKRSKYPIIDVDGFVEASYQQRDQSPGLADITATDNRWQTIQKDPIYSKLPKDIAAGQSKLETRLKFDVEGKFSDDLSVKMHIEQEPDFPGVYDVKVKKGDTKLTFWHYDTTFETGPFLNTQKALNGFMYERDRENERIVFAIGKERSKAKKYEAFGTGRHIVNLGNRSILNNSVKVWVNNDRLQDGSDFTINYYSGEITFKPHAIPSAIDYVEIVYEFTNPIEDFLPSMGQKDFLGAAYKWRPDTGPRLEKNRLNRTDTILVTSQNIATLNRGFQLPVTEIILGTETIKLNETELFINDDYSLKHAKGTLRIHTDILKEGDKIQMIYEFYETRTATQIIVGKDTTGPYPLKHAHIVPHTLEIKDQNYVLAQSKDYTLDPQTGEIMFNYPIQYPKLLQVRYTHYSVTQHPFTKKDAPFFFESTYLRESSKPREESLETDINSTENITLPANTATFTTQLAPLASKDHITITLDNRKLAPESFTLSNAYKGEITVSQNQLTAGSSHQIGIRYRYKKSFSTRFTFYGIPGWLNTPYVNTDQFDLVHPTVKENGITKILYWTGSTEITLLPNRDYIVNYGEDGQAIQIKFLTQDDKALHPESENSVLKEYPGPDNRITLIYQYIPNNAEDAGKLLKETLAISTGGKIAANWFYDVDVAIANNNFSKPQLDGQLVVSGNGIENYTYGLGHPNIIKDSESIFLNGIRLTKDKDFFINYTTGTLRFVNLTPGVDDLINASFTYVDARNTIVSGDNNNYSYATQFNTRYQTTNLELSSHIKWIDKDFNPIAPIKDKKGSMYYGALMNWLVNPSDRLNLGYEHVDTITAKTFNDKDVYLRSHEVKGRLDVNSIPYINTSHQGRYYYLAEDPTASSGNIYAIDQKNISYQGNVTFGPAYFRNTLNQNYSNLISDYLDDLNKSETTVHSSTYSSNFIANNVWLIGNTSVKPNIERSKKQTRTFTPEKTRKTQSLEERDKYGVIWDFEPFRTFKNKIDMSLTRIQTEAALNATPNTSTLHNRLYSSSFAPYSWVATQFSYQNTESESIAIGQQGEKSNKMTIALSKFNPFGLGRFLKVDRDNLWMIPIKNTNIHYRFTQFDSFKDNNRKETHTKSETIGLTALNPLPGLTIKTVQLDHNKADNIVNVETSTTSSNRSSSKRNSWTGASTLTPPLPILNLFTYDYTIKEITDSRSSTLSALSATSTITSEELPEHNYTHKLAFKPGLFHLFRFPLLSLSTILTEENSQRTHEKTTQLINTLQNTSSQNIKQDNATILKQGISGIVSPFNLLPFNGAYNRHKERLSRNILSTNTGLTIKQNTAYSVSTTIKPLSFLSFNGTYSVANNQQHRSPSLNASRSTLITATDDENGTLLTDFIEETNTTKTVGASLKVWSFLSLQGSGTDKVLDSQKLSFDPQNASITNNLTITQKIGTAGATLTPFSGLKAIYNYSLIYSETNGGAQQKGYTGDTKIEFTPLRTKGFNVKLLYTRTDAWGFNLNTLEQTEVESGTGDVLQSQIVERDDTVETGSLSVNIEMQNVFRTPYDEKLVITAEGFIKKITNGLDAQRKANGLQELSYEITGLTVKGTIHF